MTSKREEYYKLMIKKLKKEEEEAEEDEEKIFRVSGEYLNLLILYTTLLFFVLAEGYIKLGINFSTLPIFIFSSIFSTFALLTALSSSYLMRPLGREYCETFFHRLSILCFFVSVALLFYSLLNMLNMVELEKGFIAIFVLFVAVFIYPKIKKKLKKKKKDKEKKVK